VSLDLSSVTLINM